MSGSSPFAQHPALTDVRLDRAGFSPPLVSVVLTSYNYAPYVEQCLAGVAAQTYSHWECVVVDDASTDDSAERIQAFIDASPQRERFRLVRHAANAGQMQGFKTGLNLARGVFTVLLDSDDVLLEDFLAAHVRCHLGRRPVAFTSSNQYQVDGQGRVLSAEHLDHQSKGFYRFARGDGFHRGFWIWATASSMMYRTDVLRLVLDGQEENFRICADYYVAHFAHLIGGSLLIPAILGCYRRHGGNNFGSNPVLGALNSVGSMDNHPPHAAFRRAMLAHILAGKERFRAIFGPTDLRRLLLSIGEWEEIAPLARQHPDVLTGPGWALRRDHLRLALRQRLARRKPWAERLAIIEPDQAEPGRI